MESTVLQFARSQFASALDATGPFCVDMAREIVGVPVQRLNEIEVVRSRPGEPPRREFGNLQDSAAYRVNRAEPSMDVYFASEVAVLLNDCGPNFNGQVRPILAPLSKALEESLPAKLEANFNRSQDAGIN